MQQNQKSISLIVKPITEQVELHPFPSVVGFTVNDKGTMNVTYSNIIPGSFILTKKNIDIAYKTFKEASIKEGEIIKKELWQ